MLELRELSLISNRYGLRCKGIFIRFDLFRLIPSQFLSSSATLLLIQALFKVIKDGRFLPAMHKRCLFASGKQLSALHSAHALASPSFPNQTFHYSFILDRSKLKATKKEGAPTFYTED